MHKKKLYYQILFLSLTGYIWIYFCVGHEKISHVYGKVCMFKNITGVPCPSCGTTRAIQCLIRGKFYEALITNPLGYLVGIFLLLFPFWIIFDIVRKKKSFLDFFNKCEILLRHKWVAIPAVLLILLNWIWNISKHL